jgi:hypothetical protein
MVILKMLSYRIMIKKTKLELGKNPRFYGRNKLFF